MVKNLNPNDYDFVIIDESHRWITGYPKRSTIWKQIRPFTVGKRMIYSSGTLTPEGYSGLFNMLALSDYSPWKRYSRFTLWFEDYGRPYSIRINQIDIKQYDRTHEAKVLKDVKKITVTITRKEAGHKYEANDVLVNIPLSKKQTKFVAKLQRDLVIPKHEIVADTPAKLLQKCHQISGGFVKNEDGDYYEFEDKPKIDYIRANFDPNDTIILCHYIAEQRFLAKLFPHTGSVKKNAEGKDFSHFKNMVIYSMDFSAATYEQVRARQLNLKTRHSEVNITYLISGIDQYVYDAVVSKKNFTASWYRKELKNAKIPL